MHRIGYLLFSVMLAVGLSVGLVAPAQATVTPTPGVYYELFPPLWNPSDHKCVDVFGGSTAPGSALDLFNCHSGDIQMWRFDQVSPADRFGPAIYQIVNKKSGLCMGLPSPFRGHSPVIQNLCRTPDNQETFATLWYVLTAGPVLANHFFILNINSQNDCVDASNLSGVDGTALVVQEPCKPITDAGFEDPGVNFQLG